MLLAPRHAHAHARKTTSAGASCSLDLLLHAPVLPVHQCYRCTSLQLPALCLCCPRQEPDDSLDLLRGATLIAQHRHPLLRHEEVVEQLDDLAVQVGSHAYLGEAS